MKYWNTDNLIKETLENETESLIINVNRNSETEFTIY